MKAVVQTRYGGPEALRLTELPVPQPRPGEVLVRVRAVSLNRSDWETLTGKPLYARIAGTFRPRRPIPGTDIAGTVEALGPGAHRFQPGQHVFADILERRGGFAQYVAVPEAALGLIPEGLDHEVASCLPQAGAIALQGIVERGEVHSGQRVLINGAGGGSGMYAIQLAKLHGAEITGVDNAEKLEFMRSVGADDVIDYTSADFTRLGRTWDLILDVVGYRSPTDYARALAPGGRYFFTGGSMSSLLRVLLLGPATGRGDGKRIRVLGVRQGVSGLGPLIELCQSGAVRTVIDRRYPLEQAAEALQYLGVGHARGKVVVVP